MDKGNLKIEEDSYFDLLKSLNLDLQELDSDLLEEKLTNSVLKRIGAPVSKKGLEYRLGDEDGLSFYINPKNDSLGFRFAKNFSNGGDIGTISPIPPSTSPLMDRIYNYINQPLNTEDPIQNLVSGVAEFIPGISTELARRKGDTMGEALSYLDYLGAGGAKLALTPFMIARRKEIQQTLKTFDEDPILKGNETVRNSLKQELDQINKTEAEDLRIKEQYEGFVKDPTTFGKKQPIKELADATKKTGRKPMSVDEIATQIRRNEEAGTPFVFRGERGIASLPNKPKYLAADALDTRLPNFSKEGFEIYKPQFNKVLDVDNMPSRIDEILTNIEMRGGRPSRTGGANQRDFDIERIRGNIRDSANKTPSSIDKGTTKIFQDEGYDALRFPPRGFKGESDTYISLDPANNLKLFENVSPDMVDDLIRELARNQMK